MATYRILIAAGLLCLGLSACQTTGSSLSLTKSTYETFNGPFITIASTRRVEAMSGKFSAGDMAVSGGPDPDQDSRLLNSEGLSRYAETIAKKLLDNWKGKKPHYRVIISSNQQIDAHARHSGNIIISQGSLVNIRSEDELAFLVAHELSHLLLNHTAQDDKDTFRNHIEDTSMGLAILATSAAPNGRTKSKVGTGLLLGYQAYRILQDNIFDNMWARSQEDEADLLGLDLMVKAGYNLAAAFQVMQRLASASEQTEQEKAKAMAAREKVVQQTFAANPTTGFSMAMGEAVGAATSGLKSLFARVTATHHAPEDREKDLKKYSSREYKRIPRRKLKTDAYDKVVFKGKNLKSLTQGILAVRADELIEQGEWNKAEALLKTVAKTTTKNDPKLRMAYYRLHTKQGKPDLALADLELAITHKDAGANIYNMLVLDYGRRDRNKNALAILDKADRKFGSRAENLALRYFLLIKSNQEDKASMVLAECRKNRNPAIIGSCEEAVHKAKRWRLQANAIQ